MTGDEDYDETTIIKIVTLFLLGGGSAFLGLIPWKVGKRIKENHGNLRHEKILSSLSCFGGGLLLAMSLLHLLPEVKYPICWLAFT